MQVISHMAFAAGIGALCGSGSREIVILATGAASPDMMDGMPAGGNLEIWRGIHRTVSHWPVLYPEVMAVIVLAGVVVPDSILRWAYMFLSGALIHISCDFCTPMGIPLYPPFTKRALLRLIRTGSILDYAVGFFTSYGLRACWDTTIGLLIVVSQQARKGKEYTSSSFSFPF